MDSMDMFFSIVNHPIKMTILRWAADNGFSISYEEVGNLFMEDRANAVQCLWELSNDRFLKRQYSGHGMRFDLTDSGKKLIAILSTFDQWAYDHSYYGGF